MSGDGGEGFAGRVALVTGAGRGIGRAIADELVRRGARTAYLDVAAPEGDLDGQRALAVPCDLRDESAVDRAVTAVEQRWGSVDVLVNNAGVLHGATVEATSLAMWEATFAVNVTGAFLVSRRVLPGMRAAGYGRIVSVGSSAGKTGGAREVGAYAASKAALMCLAKSIASEHAAHGITSNAVAPALIETDMIAGLADLASRIPVGRLGQPADVVAAVLFLAAETSSYITGEVLDVNGGFLID